MTDTQSNTTIGEGIVGAITCHTAKDAPVVFEVTDEELRIEDEGGGSRPMRSATAQSGQPGRGRWSARR